MESQLTKLLIGCTEVGQVRESAEAALKQAEQNDLGRYCQLLSRELHDNSKPPHVRQLAGLMLKNATTGKERSVEGERVKRWVDLPAELVNQIKREALDTLTDNNRLVQRTAAQLVSSLGRLELLAGGDRWPEFFPSLVQLCVAEDSRHKVVALTTLGYLCEDVEDLYDASGDDLLKPAQVNHVLTATVQGMSDPKDEVKLSATKAFYFAVIFAKENFDREHERDVMMEVLRANCQSSSDTVRTASFECIAQIASEYYGYLHHYITLLGPMTWQAISDGPDAVAIPALEFWNSICDEEIDRKEKKLESNHFVQLARPYLLPILVESLTKQSDDEDDTDTWTLAMAAGSCLSLCTQVCGNELLEGVLAFVNENFEKEHWKRREAAVMAYGCIMEGPDSDKLKPLVEKSFAAFCRCLADPSVCVRETAVWTLGRIAAYQSTVISSLLLHPSSTAFLEQIIGLLKDKPRVSTNVCWLISEIWTNVEGDEVRRTLDKYFTVLCGALISVTERPDADEKQLRESSCNALSSVISNVGDDHIEAICRLLELFLARFGQVAQNSPAPSGGINPDALVVLDCYLICIQAIIRRLQPTGKLQKTNADKIWQAITTVLLQVPPSRMSEEGMLTAMALTRAVDITDYSRDMYGILELSLSDDEHVETYKLGVELVCDVSHNLSTAFVPFLEPVMRRFYVTLARPLADRRLKPRLMIAIGDVAMAIKEEFMICLRQFMDLLAKAATTKLEDGPDDDPEWVEYFIELRSSILQAYSGIVVGMKEGDRLDDLKIHVNRMLELVQLIVTAQLPQLGDHNLNYCIALTGDLVGAFGKELMQHLREVPFISVMLERARQISGLDDATMADTKEKAQWLQSIVAKF